MPKRAGSGRVHRVVVGVDGSDCSQMALEWAAAEAARLDAVLEIHTALDSGHVFASPADVKGILEGTLEKAVERVGVLRPNLHVKTFGHDGAAAPALLQASLGADLLVVGSRGLGGFAELLLGSVSHQCTLHARCPVLIVRLSEPESTGESLTDSMVSGHP